jgi:signal transduction histidine kinase
LADNWSNVRLFSGFLDDYRAASRQVPRLERMLAGARALFTVTALGAIFLDPTEPARFAGLTYALLAAYAFYSVVVWLWIRRTWFPSVRGCFVLHGFDVLWVSVLTTISAGPFSPLFLFFLFVLLAAAYRWGFRGTLVTAIVSIGIFLIESALMAMGPWSRTLDADVPFQLSFVIIRGTYLLLTGVLLGYLAEQEKQFRAEMATIAEGMRQPRVERGLGGTAVAVAQLVRRTFQAAAADLIIKDRENERTFLWNVDNQGPGEHDSARPVELDGTQQTAWLFPGPSQAWYVERLRGGIANGGFRGWAIDPALMALRDELVKIPSTVTSTRMFQSMLVADFGLASEWQGRLILYDMGAGRSIEANLSFVEVLLDHITPGLSNVFLLRRLRERAETAERARVARELHDGAIQALIGVEMDVEALRRRTLHESLPVASDLSRIQALLRNEVVALRELIQALRPIELDSADHLPDVLASLVTRFRRDTGIAAVYVSEVKNVMVPRRTALEIVRIVQEALVNVRKHSGARHVTVRLTEEDHRFTVAVEDDGSGFGFVGRLSGTSAEMQRKGPAMILERARNLGADVTISSTPGGGSQIEVSFNILSHV